MSKQGKILVVDNLSVWYEELVETLQRGGYYANAASTLTEAIEQLHANFYHILVVDIRMNDTDRSNIDGLALLAELEKSGLSEATKVIILSAFGTPEQMREAFTNQRVADFLSKSNFSKEAFLKGIEQVFLRDAKINLALRIFFHTGSSSKQAVLNLDVDSMRVKEGNPRHDLLAEELEDLLCRLFHETKGILVRPLPSGKSGAGVLRVQPSYDRGTGQEVIVKFGDAHKIQEERLHFKEYVEPFIGGGRSTAIRDTRRTTHLGGIIYTFLGTGSQELKDFADFYQSASVEQITEALNGLFHETCATWYTNRQRQLLDLKADYQRLISYTPAELDQLRPKQVRTVRGKPTKLTFSSLNNQRKFTNPVPVMESTAFACTTYICPTHGDFNPHNLLVDNTGHIWLIDFQGTGPGHILRDIAMLDSAIRFQLLGGNAATLEQRFYLEEVLLGNIKRFSQVEQLASNIPAENQEAFAKAYASVVHLRRLAYRLIAQNQQDEADDDISEYYIALFYTALNTLQFFSLTDVQREHALLSASLLAERMGFNGE